MTTTELTASGLRYQDWRRVRWELFAFHDVRDVLPSTRPETVLVVHRGPARVGEWTEALAAAEMLDERPPPEPAA